MSARDHIRSLFRRSVATKQATMDACLPAMESIALLFIHALKNGHKLIFCGNGGSAADAQHLAAELLVRLRPSVNRAPIPAIALAMDTSTLTACGNDYHFHDIYARAVSALGQRGDVLVGITTSGKSPNILRAFEVARKQGLQNVGFLGCAGGPALALCELALVIPSDETGRIQETHITAGHAILEVVEDALMGKITFCQESLT